MRRRRARGNPAATRATLHTIGRLCKAARVSSPRSTSSLVTLLALLCASLMGGCAAATLDVVSPVPFAIDTVSIAILDDTGGDMSPDQMRSFKRIVTRALLADGIQVLPSPARSGAPRVVGSVGLYAPGIRALRFVSRYGFGTGGLESTWDVKSGRDTIARCRIEGSVSTGTFGGSFDDVQEETGKALARFLKGDIR